MWWNTYKVKLLDIKITLNVKGDLKGSLKNNFKILTYNFRINDNTFI